MADNPYNNRLNKTDHEGVPGEIIMVVVPAPGDPVVVFGGVQGDGYFTDEFYDQYQSLMEQEF